MQLVTVEQAYQPLGFTKPSQVYRAIRENQFPVPHAVLRFGKQIRINLQLVEETMRQNAASSDSAKK